MNVVIHSCDARMWYVRDFLVPALRDQDIVPEIHNDDRHEGCLRSYIRSFHKMPNDDEGTWHLEDDVYPSRDFGEMVRTHDHGIVHGFFHRYGNEKHAPGWVPMHEAGYSFPCFRLPNRYAVEFVDWFLNDARRRDVFRRWVKGGKHIDSFMLAFLKECHADEAVFNLSPSIVEHVDEYIGGSTINQWRKTWWKADEFKDQDLIEELKVKIAGRK